MLMRSLFLFDTRVLEYHDTDTWLHSQMSLLEHRFDHNVAFLELVHMKTIQSRWKEIVIVGEKSRPERVGYLYKQAGGGPKKDVKHHHTTASSAKSKSRRHTESHIAAPPSTTTLGVNVVGDESGRNFKSLRKKSKRWFVLKGLFLACFKSREDALPSLVIPLDYYIVRLSDEFKKGERIMSLYKCVPSFPKGLLGDFALCSELENENELRLWFQSTNGKCANTALNRVFGMPLLHQLCHNQYGYVKRPNLGLEDPLFQLPPFLTQCIKFLSSDGIDQEGIFRVSHISAEVLAYREFFDTGVEIDLHGTNPHCVSALIKAWLRELPEPLIPNNLYGSFLQAVASTKDKELKLERIFQLAETVPLHSLRTLSYLACFMKLVVSYTLLNRMTFSALAIVVAPCILRPQSELRDEEDEEDHEEEYNPLQLLKEVPQINEVLLLLFENSDRLAHLVEQIDHRVASEANPSSPTTISAEQDVPASKQQPTMLQRQLPPKPSNQSETSSQTQVAQRAQTSATTAPPQQHQPPPTTSALTSTSLSSTSASASTSTSTSNGLSKVPSDAIPDTLKLDLSSVKQLRRRSSSSKVILSLNEELPPLKEGQITIFTPSGVTPTVTIEPAPRSLRATSPKWGKKVRNQSQWKGGMVGGGRRSGSTSPVPPVDGAPTEFLAFESAGRRSSEDHSLPHLTPLFTGDGKKFSSALAQDSVNGNGSHAAENGVSSSGYGGLSPRGTWSQPISPDHEGRLLSMLMTLQQSHEILAARVYELEERLAQEIAQRTALELKLMSMNSK